VPYFHLVFTLPDALGQIALDNPWVVYNLLFHAAAAAVQKLAADADHLGARIGMLAVLHTWGQALQFHPHLHCVVPGGGLSLDGTQWISSHPRFFLPVRALSRLFRGKFLAGLRAAYTNGKLHIRGVCPKHQTAAFERLASAAARTDWVVYAKPPFGGPERVLKYLARYTHRVAISNRRLLNLKDGVVRFRYKDYAHGNRKRIMQLSAQEFVRRFLLHVLPRGFMRIRRYGLLSNRNREDLQLCRELLTCGSKDGAKPPEERKHPEATEPITPTRVCPHCGADRMVIISEFPPLPWAETVPVRAWACVGIDSS
jgi:Putative transposase